jgi:alkanesulfonate monooxygenase SsuD/methylene tetrahydromethanopterin reductase-like flavin-dependent oxidoreductase (luciferase family)
MRFALGLPTTQVGTPDEFLTGAAIAEMARHAEDLGFEAVHVTDHPAGDQQWLDTGGHHALDPFVALSFAAAATTRLRVQTHIIVLPYRNPFLTAKSVLSLDVLSGGRLTLGVAAGYLRSEFNALGVDFNERNELFDEALEVMRLALTRHDHAPTSDPAAAPADLDRRQQPPRDAESGSVGGGMVPIPESGSDVRGVEDAEARVARGVRDACGTRA